MVFKALPGAKQRTDTATTWSSTDLKGLLDLTVKDYANGKCPAAWLTTGFK